MEELVQLSKVFSDHNRLKILALILRDKEVCVCEVCDTLQLSQPLVSRHLKQMKEARVLEATQSGKWVIYSLHHDAHSSLKCWIDEIKKYTSALPSLVTCSTK